MKTSKILQQFGDCIETMYETLDEIVDLLELEIEDEELSILVEKFQDELQDVIDNGSEKIIQLIEEL